MTSYTAPTGSPAGCASADRRLRRHAQPRPSPALTAATRPRDAAGDTGGAAAGGDAGGLAAGGDVVGAAVADSGVVGRAAASGGGGGG
eukprot:gene8065-5869_t